MKGRGIVAGFVARLLGHSQPEDPNVIVETGFDRRIMLGLDLPKQVHIAAHRLPDANASGTRLRLSFGPEDVTPMRDLLREAIRRLEAR